MLALPPCYFTFYTNMTDLKSMTDGLTSGGNDSVATYECSDRIVMDFGKSCQSSVELKQQIGGLE
jgi:hypothetical protein